MIAKAQRQPLVLALGEGRHYDCGAMQAVFKADGDETDSNYSVSEWWLAPHSKGPGAHSHDANDEIFFVMAGHPTILVGAEWIDLAVGGMVIIPAGVTHDFENRTDARAGLLNVFIPGDFEKNMPAIAQWFANNPR